MPLEENLNLIPQLLKNLDEVNNKLVELEEKLISNKFNLSKKSDVAKFLNCTTKTIDNMVLDGRLKE